jgi:TolA-binding protein
VTAVVLRIHPAAPAPTATPAGTPSAAAAPSFVLALDKPDVRLTANALVRRGAGHSATFVEDVAPALNAYRAGDYQTAEREFERIAPQYPDAIEVAFYQGVTRLFLNDAAGATTALESARRLGDETFAAEIAWYLAVADERAGNLVSARAELTTLCAGSSDYRARACDASARLR